jgi:voltage-gated potassium channel
MQSKFVRANEDVLFSIVNLLVFIFIITAVVYVTQEAVNPAISNYVDALYFTIATLTTTGFGDITLMGTSGRILAVLIMIFGISLFLRLIQTIFRPSKIRYECPACGLTRHEPDAIHCKHCGTLIHITSEGND